MCIFATLICNAQETIVTVFECSLKQECFIQNNGEITNCTNYPNDNSTFTLIGNTILLKDKYTTKEYDVIETDNYEDEYITVVVLDSNSTKYFFYFYYHEKKILHCKYGSTKTSIYSIKNAYTI